MKILHLLSQIQITGAETHVLSLGEALKDLGHEILLVSDEIHGPHNFEFIPLPIHRGNKSYFKRLRNAFLIRKIIRNQKIDLVHSHSRAANLVAQLACETLPGAQTPYVTTVHGRWRNTFAFRKFPCLGRLTVAMCPYLKRYLAEDIGFPKEKIRLIPNGVNCEKFSPSPQAGKSPIILYVGRFSGQKGVALRFLLEKVFPQVLQRMPAAKIHLLADEPSRDERRILQGLKGAVSIIQAPKLMSEVYQNAAVVCGAGRVALEAMASGVPVIAIGESSAPGLLSSENFEEAYDSNFGDCGEWNLFLGQEANLIQDLVQVLRDESLAKGLSEWGRKKALEQFDHQRIAEAISTVYLEAIA